MHVEQKHNLSGEEAIRRINTFIEDMMSRELPAGVKVIKFEKNWAGNQMSFESTAKKGFFGVTIAGTVAVTDEVVSLDAELPGIVTAFMPEGKIQEDLQKQMARVLAG